MKKSSLIIFAALASACIFAACSVDGADDEIIFPNYIGSSGVESDSTADTLEVSLDVEELVFGYSYLDVYYIYSKKELQDIEAYYGMGEKNGFSAKDYEFPDVYYMYSSINDDFTNYYGPKYRKQMLEWLYRSETLIGIGAEVKASEDKFVVTQVYIKGPSEKAGLKVGDTVLTVNEKQITSVEDFQKKASGKEGETVKLSVKRGDKEEIISIKLATFLMPSVFQEKFDTIPILRITEFTDTTVSDSGTYGEFLNALQETKDSKNIIVDLRGNPGGTFSQCLMMAAEFLSKGDTLIIEVATSYDSKTDDQRIDTTYIITDKDGVANKRNAVFLADEKSASCSESMLAAVTNNRKFPIIGKTTYGKGIGQYYNETPAGGFVGTTALLVFDKFLKSFHSYGIAPDYETTSEKEMYEKAAEWLNSGYKRTAGYGTEKTGNFNKALFKRHGIQSFQKGGAYRVNPLPQKQ